MFRFTNGSQSLSEFNTQGIFCSLFRVVEAEHRAEYSNTDAEKAEARKDVDSAITSVGWLVYTTLLSDARGETFEFRKRVAATRAAPKAPKQTRKRKTGRVVR